MSKFVSLRDSWDGPPILDRYFIKGKDGEGPVEFIFYGRYVDEFEESEEFEEFEE